VVGELVRVLTPILGREPDIVMSGRTDAGVHAWGQVLSFHAVDPGPKGPLDLPRLQKSINSRLGPEVVVREISRADVDFSARFSATGRRYRYWIVNRPVPDPFRAHLAWWVETPLDLTAMEQAAQHLLGEHDFSSFCRQPKPRPPLDDPAGPAEAPSMVRRITGVRWIDEGDDVLRFEIEGSAFCHQMVRSIVGFLVAVGVGKRSADEMPTVLSARDRQAAEQPAPPHGLTLWQVDY
jgi:tRNA pseudouridine38-40 synthase